MRCRVYGKKRFPALEDSATREARNNASACDSISVAVGASLTAVPPI